MAYCDACGAPVHGEDCYEGSGMCICPDCLSALEEALTWLDEQG